MRIIHIFSIKSCVRIKTETHFPVSILHKSIAGCYRPVRVADGPITARCRFIKNASWEAGLSPKVVFLLTVPRWLLCNSSSSVCGFICGVCSASYLSLFPLVLTYPSYFCCPGTVVLLNCAISWVSSLIFFKFVRVPPSYFFSHYSVEQLIKFFLCVSVCVDLLMGVVWWDKDVMYLSHHGVHLILAYSWARPAMLAAGKDRGGNVFMSSFCSLSFIFSPFPLSCISSTISSISLLPCSGRRHKMTHKDWRVVKPPQICWWVRESQRALAPVKPGLSPPPPPPHPATPQRAVYHSKVAFVLQFFPRLFALFRESGRFCE